MGVLKDFMVDLLAYCIEWEFYLPAGPLLWSVFFGSFLTWFTAGESEFSLLVGPLHMKWVYKFTLLSYGLIACEMGVEVFKISLMNEK